MRTALAGLLLLPFVGAIALAAAAGYVTGEERPGGAATNMKVRSISAFSQFSANLDFERQLDFKVGDGIFRKQWVSSPSSTRSSDGLGPLFNARGCQNCHLKDGRGHPPAAGEAAVSMLLKLSVPPRTDVERKGLAAHETDAIPEPAYGSQLQTFAIQGHAAEGQVAIDYQDEPVKLADGKVVALRRPTYRITDLGYGALDPETMVSPRIAPPMIGMGLLELIPEAEILARADPGDRDGDGIRGIAQAGWSRSRGHLMLGRFGWKAGAPTIADQAAAAFGHDMGLSTPPLHVSAGDCTETQAACLAAPDGRDEEEGVEVPAKMFDLVVFYAQNLAVPGRPDARKAQVLDGKRVFGQIGCAACHTPSHVTGDDPARAHLSKQTIWPYTDLLLHDMGEGLADSRPEGKASGRHWRTPPLWGLGLTRTVNGHTFLLHDGRARGVLEAILWHGGEAKPARDRVVGLDAASRAALLAFLESQ